MSGLHGAVPLARLLGRRDRVRLLAWVAGIVLLVVATAGSTKGLYATQADLDAAAAASRDNPVALAFNGPDQGLDTIGGQVAFQMSGFALTMVGLMALLLVGRATRGEEDSGRLELVRALPVGRHAPLAAALAVVAGTQVLLGALVTASLIAFDLPVTGSIVFGLSLTAFGLALVGVTALAAQVSENPRVVAGSAGAVLGASFLLRAIGDVGDGRLSWLSPMGWAQQARPYAGERWWPLALCLVLGGLTTAAAAALATRRDFGAGLVAPKPGPPRAAPGLAHPFGLAVRLQRGAVLWWGFAVLVLGATYGSLAEAIDDFVVDNQAMQDLLAAGGGANLIDAFLSTSLLIIALVAAGPVLQVLVRLRTEESEHRAEVVLATAVSRTRWVVSQLGVALGGGALVLAAGGAGLGLGYAAVGGGADQVPRLLASALAFAPAVAVLAGVAVLLFGVAPRWTAGAWIPLIGCFVLAMFGTLLGLPGWLLDLSPFQHVPAVPVDRLEPVPLVLLAAVATALIGAGLRAFRTRDLVGV